MALGERLMAKGLAVRVDFGHNFWIMSDKALAKHFAEGLRTDATYEAALEWCKAHPTEATYWPVNDVLTTVQAIDPKTNRHCIKKAFTVLGIKRLSIESIGFRQRRRDYVIGWLRKHPFVFFEGKVWRDFLAHYARYNDEHPAGCRSVDMPEMTFKYYCQVVKGTLAAEFADEERRQEERADYAPES